MAWAPSTNFEDDLVDLQPDSNFVLGQLAYEAANRRDPSRKFTPRPKSTYDFLEKREKRNQQLEQKHGTRTKEISASLAMMERIQEIAGTKSLGEHATMADLEDRSTVEREVVAMMRHFGMMSMADGALQPCKDDDVLQPKGKIHIIHNGRKRFPLILDPSYFEPGRTRKTSNHSSDVVNTSSSDSSIYCDPHEAFEESESSALYGSAKSDLDETTSSQNSGSFVDIPYQLLKCSDPEPDLIKISKPKTTNNNWNK
ncbi:hypothetical protein KR044_013191, partial [Drosophila immigrans]